MVKNKSKKQTPPAPRPRQVIRPVAAPVARSSLQQMSSEKGRLKLSGNAGERIRIQGRDFLDSVTIPSAGCAVGTVLSSIELGLSTMGNIRLQRFGTLFQHWKVRAMRVHFATTAPTTLAGAVGGMVWLDPDGAPLGTGSSNLQVIQAASGSEMHSVWQDAVYNRPRDGEYTELFCQADPMTNSDRLTNAGRLFIVAATAFPSTTSATTVGNLFIEYDIEFHTPMYASSSGGSYGLVNIFTTSTAAASATPPFLVGSTTSVAYGGTVVFNLTTTASTSRFTLADATKAGNWLVISSAPMATSGNCVRISATSANSISSLQGRYYPTTLTYYNSTSSDNNLDVSNSYVLNLSQGQYFDLFATTGTVPGSGVFPTVRLVSLPPTLLLAPTDPVPATEKWTGEDVERLSKEVIQRLASTWPRSSLEREAAEISAAEKSASVQVASTSQITAEEPGSSGSHPTLQLAPRYKELILGALAELDARPQ